MSVVTVTTTTVAVATTTLGVAAALGALGTCILIIDRRSKSIDLVYARDFCINRSGEGGGGSLRVKTMEDAYPLDFYSASEKAKIVHLGSLVVTNPLVCRLIITILKHLNALSIFNYHARYQRAKKFIFYATRNSIIVIIACETLIAYIEPVFSRTIEIK